MDRNDKGKIEVEKRDGDAVDYHSPSSMWQYGCEGNFTNSSMELLPNGNTGTTVRGVHHPGGPSSSSSSMVDSFVQRIWDHPHNPQPLGFSENRVRSGPGTSNPVIDVPKEVPVLLRGGGAGVQSGWDGVPSTTLKGGLFLSNVPPGMMLPHSLAQCPADSAFIERAARFSSFNAGNLGDMVNPFGINQSANPFLRGGPILGGPQENFSGNAMKALSSGGQFERNEVNVAETSKDMVLPTALMAVVAEDNLSKIEREGERSQDEGKPRIATYLDESDQAQSSGYDAVGQMDMSGGEASSSKGLSSKKRKRGGQGNVSEQNAVQQQSGEVIKDNTEIQQKGEQNLNSTADKSTGKHGKLTLQRADQATEEYIHVRARRGQATNSHSLAERVRREKISERMKFLQDLVPGCSKVTGKAVMLDEIINYVQSLQRQVEFLSMKLATVNPRLDFNIESLLAKDQMFCTRAGPSLGLTPDLPIAYPPLHPSQPPIVLQSGLPGIGNSSDTLRRTITSQPSTAGGVYKEPTQLTNAWEDELHNIVQMGFNSSIPLDGDDMNS